MRSTISFLGILLVATMAVQCGKDIPPGATKDATGKYVTPDNISSEKSSSGLPQSNTPDIAPAEGIPMPSADSIEDRTASIAIPPDPSMIIIDYSIMQQRIDELTLYIESKENKPQEELARAYYQRGEQKMMMNDADGACEDFRKSVSLGFTAAEITIETRCK